MKAVSLFASIMLAGILAAAQQPETKPSGKRPPQAKTQQEYKDYNTDYALTGGAAVEKAANEFAAKYPQSELREYLYSKAMHEYQNENNPAKMLAMGEKVLALDPDNSIALVLTATVLADSLSDADQDREQKIAEIRKNSQRALDTVDTGFAPPANATPEQIEAYKNTLQSMAHSALGIMELKNKDDAGAEKDLRAAADLNKVQPDPYIWYHLALAQDHLATAMADKAEQQKKYVEALASVNQALQYTGTNQDLSRLAQGERERLQTQQDYNTDYALTGGAAVEKAANEFAAKYPRSELRKYLYSKAMHEYQNENNPAKMLAMGEKVLALDPDNSIALVLTATVLADSLSDADQDRDQKIAEIKKNSQRALDTVDTGFAPPANATPEQIEAYKNTLQSMAHSALGIMELKNQDDASAEKDLRTAADLNKVQPDPHIWYHLALAQDHLATAMADKTEQQKKYVEALASVNQALQYTGANQDLSRLAQGERERLQKLASASTPAAGGSKPPQ